MEFRVREIEIPLFGVIEKGHPPEELFRRFAEHATTSKLVVDNNVYEIVADQLELDSEGVVYDLRRYVNGEYRSKSKGPGGNRLGDFAEVVTFLYLRRQMDIARVVGWKAAGGQVIKGGEFIQPDFVVSQGPLQGCLEVKSTEALEYRDLLRMSHWRGLKPCKNIKPLRAEALRQLAYDQNGKAWQPEHFLKVGKKAVPFPTDFAIAVAVLVRDGRLDDLEADKNYKTPPVCSSLGRNCWSCLRVDDDDAAHVTLVRMTTDPCGVASSGDESRPRHGSERSWFGAYRRWEEAIWSRESDAVKATADRLDMHTREWFAEALQNQPDAARRRTAERFEEAWLQYMSEAAAQRGLEDAAPEAARGRFDVQQVQRRRPRVIRGAREEVIADSPVEPTEVSRYNVELLEHDNFGRSTVAVERSRDLLDMRMCSGAWWSDRTIEDYEAAVIARNLLRFGLQMERSRLANEHLPLELDRVLEPWGNRRELVGWAIRPWWRSAASDWGRFFGRQGSSPPSWLPAVFGDAQRARLFVFPDGRAHLRVIQQHD